MRTTRQFSLTEEGQNFLGKAEAALEALSDAEGTVRDDVKRLSGPLNAAAPVSYGFAKM